MALTEIQKYRIKFHLGYANSAPASHLVAAEYHLLLDSLTATSELIVVGDLSDPLKATHVKFQGLLLASEGSVLALTEQAYLKLNPTDLDASLQVAQVGKVTLRGDELFKRRDLYDFYRKQLAQTLNTHVLETEDANCRVGYTY